MTSILIGPVVRATSSTSVIVWAAFSEAGEVVLTASPDTAAASAVSIRVHTVSVGGRHFAAPQLRGLEPGCWYHYRFATPSGEEVAAQELQLEQCFRTLDAPGTASALPFVYGSCRKLSSPRHDALSAFGRWLLERFEQREQTWPRFQLFIGDQIYADQPPPTAVGLYPQLRGGARTFEDFALLYDYAWTVDPHTRQALASLPTYMIFDDHEIDNNWNNTPGWRAEMLEKGKEQVIIDGMVAYWVFQGWGNIEQRGTTQHPLLHIMEEGQKSGADVLDELRTCIKLSLDGKLLLRWHYELPTTPPIFVANARADRTQVQDEHAQNVYEPAGIMGKQQMEELRTWMRQHDSGPVIFVSSVPVLLPPLIGLAEYVTGVRPLWHSPLRRLSRQVARLQTRLSTRFSFDHWPLYSRSWRDLVQQLKRRRSDLIVLSGDVHFSYALEAHPTFGPGKAHLYQLVCTPIQNSLGKKDLRLIQVQSPIKRLSYGGLTSHLLPLYDAEGKTRISRDLLLQNTLAYVTVPPGSGRRAQLHQEYLGVVNESMEPVAQMNLP